MAFKKRKVIRKKTFKRRSAKRPSGIKKMVRREIARNVEDKTQQTYNLGLNIRGPTHANFDDQVVQISPCATALTISQGTGQGSRVGNSIKIKRCMFKGTLVPIAYDATVNPTPTPLQVKMFLFYDKLAAPNDAITPKASNDFFQNGNSSTGFHNDLVDMWSPVNADRYKVFYTKIFKLGYAEYAGTGVNVAQQGFANNDFKFNQNFNIDITKYMVKHLKYKDNSSDPSTRSLYCMWLPSYATGATIGSTINCAGVQYMLDIKYEDA